MLTWKYPVSLRSCSTVVSALRYGGTFTFMFSLLAGTSQIMTLSRSAWQETPSDWFMLCPTFDSALEYAQFAPTSPTRNDKTGVLIHAQAGNVQKWLCEGIGGVMPRRAE